MRVRCAWDKFRVLSVLLTHKKVSLKLKGRLYKACVRIAIIHGNETLAMSTEQLARFDRTEIIKV